MKYYNNQHPKNITGTSYTLHHGQHGQDLTNNAMSTWSRSIGNHKKNHNDVDELFI